MGRFTKGMRDYVEKLNELDDESIGSAEVQNRGDVSGNITLDWGGRKEIRLRLTGNTTVTSMSNMGDGLRYLIKVEQDGSGGHSFDIDGLRIINVDLSGLSTDADAVNFVGIHYDEDDSVATLMAVN